MKKSFLALAVAALAATSIASTASAATVYDKDGNSLAVYGRVQSVLYSDKANGVADDAATISTSARLGVDMRSQLTSGIAAFAKAEWEGANADGPASEGNDHFATRYLWVGVDFGQFGSVKVGRFEPAIKYAIGQTDIFDDWGCAGLIGNDDKREGVVQYQWSGYGFDAIASYVFAKNGEHIDGAYEIAETADMDSTVSLALGYTSPDVVFGPIAVRAGFEHGEFSNTAKNVIVKDVLAYDSYDQFAAGLSWGSLDLGPYIAAVYQQREFSTTALGANTAAPDMTVSGYEFAVGYSFANGITARAGYNTKKYEIDGEGEVKGANVPVYVNFQINPQFNVWGEACFDASSDVGAHDVNVDENVYSAGIRYVF